MSVKREDNKQIRKETIGNEKKNCRAEKFEGNQKCRIENLQAKKSQVSRRQEKLTPETPSEREEDGPKKKSNFYASRKENNLRSEKKTGN